MLADRMVLLDHLTRGRVMLGVGPGALPSDAFMMGIPVAEQRDRMEEALEAILLLLRSDEPVTHEDRLVHARRRPARTCVRTRHPHFEIAVASQISPVGSARRRARSALGLLSIGATNQQGFDLLGYHWQIAEERAAEFGTSVDRRNWRLVGPDAHRRDPRAGVRRRASSGWRTGSTTSSASPRCRSRPTRRR